MRPTRPRTIRRVLLLGGLGLGVALGLAAPMTTRQGVNFQVANHHIPLYVKAVDFLDRHYHYQLLADQITHSFRSDRERALAVFEWTHQHIQPTPRGWPIVDDHVWHIIIRGHGVEDQVADVFTTLCAYAGVPAYWRYVRHPRTGASLTVSYAKVGNRWAVIDMRRAVIFKDAGGTWLTPGQLAADPALSQVADQARLLETFPYPDYFATPEFVAPPPYPLRTEQQMPWPRLVFEFRRVFHLMKETSVKETNAAVVPP